MSCSILAVVQDRQSFVMPHQRHEVQLLGYFEQCSHNVD